MTQRGRPREDDEDTNKNNETMSIVSILNVRRWDGEPTDQPSSITFEASPGNIMAAETQPDETIDGTGCTIMPGLIDCKINADAAVSSLQRFASCGITTVIDLSSDSMHSEAMRSASLEAPGLTSYLFAGSGIGSPANASSTVFEHRAIRGVNTAGEALKLIAEDSSGLFQTDFVRLTVEAPALGDSILVSAVDAAHQHGKLAIAYASTADSYRLAVKSGFDVITPVPNDAPLDAAVVAQLADANVAVIPTLRFQKHKMDLEQTQAPKGQTSRTQIAQALANVKTLHEAGVRICAGTSSNERGHMSIPFGLSLHEELQLLVEAGLSNREAIQSATSIPARVFGLGDRGSLEPGQHRADLVLVEGDPSEDVTALSRIQRVWIEGIEVLRKV